MMTTKTLKEVRKSVNRLKKSIDALTNECLCYLCHSKSVLIATMRVLNHTGEILSFVEKTLLELDGPAAETAPPSANPEEEPPE